MWLHIILSFGFIDHRSKSSTILKLVHAFTIGLGLVISGTLVVRNRLKIPA
jgi:hypothetical protein